MIAVECFADHQDANGSGESQAGGSDTLEHLEAHLALLNRQIEKFSKLAIESSDLDAQESYWQVARDLSREAHEVSRLIQNLHTSCHGIRRIFR